MRHHPVLVASLLFLVGCQQQPSIEVCRRVTADGRCDASVTELATGAQHVMLVHHLRVRDVEVRIVKLDPSGERTLGTRQVRAVEGRHTIGVPLTLPTQGDYRVDVLAGDKVLATQRLRAPNVPAHPIP